MDTRLLYVDGDEYWLGHWLVEDGATMARVQALVERHLIDDDAAEPFPTVEDRPDRILASMSDDEILKLVEKKLGEYGSTVTRALCLAEPWHGAEVLCAELLDHAGPHAYADAGSEPVRGAESPRVTLDEPRATVADRLAVVVPGQIEAFDLVASD